MDLHTQVRPTETSPLAPEQVIIFSLRGGFVWATWPQSGAILRLGSYRCVVAMMKDFLAQESVANRLMSTPH